MKMHAVRETNHYYKQYKELFIRRGKQVPEADRYFEKLTVAEFDRYLAIIMIISLVAPGYSYQDL